jgi:uncharacterized membrane protein YoaK (UPF0700 family)
LSLTPRAVLVALFGLTFVTGVIDAASVLDLGHVFVANMTGNVVFSGFALARLGDVWLSAALTALVAFLLGAVLGGRLGRKQASPSAHGFALELGLLVAASAIAFAPATVARTYALVTCLALAMGLRNALVRALAIPDMTTTVLTLTLTGLAADSSLAGGDNPRWGRRVGSVAAMLSGAFTGALLLSHAPRFTIAFAASLELLAVLLLLRSTREHG